MIREALKKPPKRVMVGDPVAYKYSVRDLASIDKALEYVRTKEAVVQAGACLGVHPAYLATRFKSVYAFEPDPMLFRIAQLNAPERNISWYHAALGYERVLVSTACVRRDGSTASTHAGLTHTVPGGVIPTLQIDDFALPYCGLICLDIEGQELPALHGAADTMGRCRPVIMVEVNKQCEAAGFRQDDVRDYIRMLCDYDRVAVVNSDEIWVSRS